MSFLRSEAIIKVTVIVIWVKTVKLILFQISISVGVALFLSGNELLRNFLYFVVEHSFLLRILLLDVFLQQAFKLLYKLPMDFKVDESVAKLSLAEGYLKIELSLEELLLLDLDNLLNKVIT